MRSIALRRNMMELLQWQYSELLLVERAVIVMQQSPHKEEHNIVTTRKRDIVWKTIMYGSHQATDCAFAMLA